MPNTQQLTILRPVQTNRRMQRFGENQACAQTMPGGFPYRPYRIVDKRNGVCPQGSKDFYRLIDMKGHNGQDQATWSGEPGYHCALFKGWLSSGHDQDRGLNVMVVSNDAFMRCTEPNCGQMHHVMMIYAHGKKMIGWDKKQVRPGDSIMLCDNTGDSSGNHCHFAPKWCNADGTQIHLDNGYSGAFNPEPYYQNIFILDYLKEITQSVKNVALVHPSIPPVLPAPATLSTLDQMRKALFNASLFLSSLMHN